MSTRLVLLGLLRLGPLHGYELKRLIEERMGDWTDIAFGSIYFALAKLREEGFVSDSEPERGGKRPARIVYSITEPGRAEFLRLLRETFVSRQRHRYEIDIALAFHDALPPAEVEDFFASRLGGLEAARSALRDHEIQELARPGVPPSAALIFSHSRLHLEAEIEWTRSVLDALASR